MTGDSLNAARNTMGVNEMLVLIHVIIVIVAVANVVPALRRVREQYLRLIIFSFLGLIHGLAPAFYYIVATPRYTEAVAYKAAALALIGTVLLSLGWMFYELIAQKDEGRRHRLRMSLQSDAGKSMLKRLFWAMLIVGMVGWFIEPLTRGVTLSNYFSAERFVGRLDTGYANIPFQYASKLILIPAFLGFLINRKYTILSIAFVLLVAPLEYLSSAGTRGNSIGLLGALLIGYLTSREVRIRRIVVLGAAGAAILLLTVSLYDLRHQMRKMTNDQMVDYVLSAEAYEELLNRDPLDYHKYLVAVVHYFPEVRPYVDGATYRRIIFFALPQKWFPSIKPVDTNMVVGAVINPHLHGNMTPPTMFGDLYLNFWGWPGIAGMVLWGVVLAHVNRKAQESLLWFILSGAGAVYLVIFIGRGAPHLTFIQWLILYFGLGAFLRILDRRRYRKVRLYIAGKYRDTQAAGMLGRAPVGA